MKRIAAYVVMVLFVLLSSCAHVPKESVTLSATVGRDIAEMHRAHRELVVLLYDRMAKDVNKFVDEVYVPYQIQKTMKEYQDILKDAIMQASKSDPTGEAQEKVVALMTVYIEELRNEIESYRNLKLKPIKAQRKSFLSELDDSYQKIHYANSIVTGHLGSVVKLHETQSEILEKVKLEELRTKVGKKAAELSIKLSDFVDKAHKSEEKVDELSTSLEELIEKYAGGD